MKITIECKNCGEPCGSYYTAQTYGDPSNCYPAEYGQEPAVIEDDGSEYCSDECAAEWHEANDEKLEPEEDEPANPLVQTDGPPSQHDLAATAQRTRCANMS
jgi:hypothetical protein